MKAKHNITIHTAMVGVLTLLALLIAMAMGLGIYTSSKTGGYLESIDQVDTDQLNVINEVNNEQSRVRSLLLSTVDEVRAHQQPDRAVLDQVSRGLDKMAVLLEQFDAAKKTTKQEKLAEPLSSSVKALIEVIRRQKNAVGQGDIDAFNALNSQMVTPIQKFHDSLAELADYANQHNRSIVANFDHTKSLSNWLYIALTGLTIVLLATAYVGLRLLVFLPLGGAVKRLEAIAKADLSEHIGVRSDNEIGKLFAAMRHMQRSLGKIVGDVHHSSESIYNGSTEISRANVDLSARTEEQAASLEETATSMEQITATVKQNADNARHASGLANDASATASQGGQIMERVTLTMHEITDSSKKVAEIIGMIDAIAFQTNILALNASVEAARAGEQGRGFAVVAGEVRNLAGRSADAAREIKQLIESSTRQVGEGSAQVEQAGKTMHEVVSAVKRVTDIIDEISAASQEQSSGIEQINQAVSQMDEVTQQNVALVEQVTAAATSLTEQATRLETSVSVFRLAERGQGGHDRADDGFVTSVPVSATGRPVNFVSRPVLKRPQLATVSAEDDWQEF